MKTLIEKWILDDRYYYVREVVNGSPLAPYLAVVDDFGNLVLV